MLLAVAFASLTAAAAPVAVAAPALALPFGGAPQALGLTRDDEASPEGPGSLAVDDDGRVYVLDGVHGRVAIFDPREKRGTTLVAELRLDSDTVEDIALTPAGDVVALDRLVDRVVTVYADNGAVLARANVDGVGVDDAGLVTAVVADAAGVWVEVQRGTQVRVLDADLAVDTARATRPGLPLGDAKTATRFVRLQKVGDAARVLVLDAHGVLVDDGAVQFGSLLRVAGLGVRGDRVVVAGHELVQKAPGALPDRDAIVVVTLRQGPHGFVEVARVVAPASPEFTPLKEVVVTNTGVAHLWVDSLHATGSEVRTW